MDAAGCEAPTHFPVGSQGGASMAYSSERIDMSRGSVQLAHDDSSKSSWRVYAGVLGRLPPH